MLAEPASAEAPREPDSRRQQEWERAASDVAIDELDRARGLIAASDWGAARRVLRPLGRDADAEVSAAARQMLAGLNPDLAVVVIGALTFALLAYVITLVY
jgi:hypothetical protein